MRFFTRCKILYRVLMFFCVCLGMILGIRMFSVKYYFLTSECTRSFVYFCIACLVFVFLILCLVILKCIIRDAEEDLAAIMKMKDESKTHIRNPDVK